MKHYFFTLYFVFSRSMILTMCGLHSWWFSTRWEVTVDDSVSTSGTNAHLYLKQIDYLIRRRSEKKNPYLGYTWFGGALFCLQKSCHNYNFVLLPEPNLMNKDISIMTVFKCRWLYKIPKCVQRENKQQSPSFSSPNFSKLREPPAEGSEFLLHWLDKTFFQISQITFVWVSTAALSKRPDGKINCRRK